MNLRVSCRRLVSSVVASCTLASMLPCAQAALGGTVEPVASNEAQLRGTRRVAQRPGHQVHEMVLDTGTVVREFTNPAGLVFAVTWQGPMQPDLRLLLGSHFPRLVAAGQAPHRDRRALTVRDSGLVIESGGRMRAFAGRAYLPAQVPASVSLEDLK